MPQPPLPRLSRDGAFVQFLRVPVQGHQWRDDLHRLRRAPGNVVGHIDGSVQWSGTAEELTDALNPQGPPWLVPPGPQPPRYETRPTAPLRQPDLHRTFARLAGNQRRILAFANRWGMLSHGEALAQGRVCPYWRGEFPWHKGPPWDWDSQPPIWYGEPLPLWHREIRSMRALVGFWDLISDEQSDTLKRFVGWDPDGREVRLEYACSLDGLEYELTGKLRRAAAQERERRGDGQALRILTEAQAAAPAKQIEWRPLLLAHVGSRTGALLMRQWRRGDTVGPVRYWVFHEVNRRLAHHVEPGLLSATGQIGFHPDCLIASLYLLFAHEVSGQRKLTKVCERRGCGESFFPDRRGMKYCSRACSQGAYHDQKREGRRLVAAP